MDGTRLNESSNFEDYTTWWNRNLSEKELFAGLPWNLFFAALVGVIWSERNCTIFRYESFGRDEVIIKRAKNLATDYIKSWRASPISPRSFKDRVELIGWTKPNSSFKFNTDGRWNESRNLAEVGGIIRDSECNWVNGFSRNIRCDLGVVAELIALYEGLNLAENMGIRELCVEIDSQEAMEVINQAERGCGPVVYWLDGIRKILGRNEFFVIKIIYREANLCADWLAKSGLRQGGVLETFSNPPRGISRTFTYDKLRWKYPRLVYTLTSGSILDF